MSLLSTLLAAGSFAVAVTAQTVSASAGAGFTLNANATSSTTTTGVVSGNDEYRVYAGRATSAFWPTTAKWVSDFDTMFNQNLPNLKIGCTQFRVPNNNDVELTLLRSAIKQVSSENGVDPRFIFAVVMQESVGCVRAPSTFYSHNNPGLMQSHQGSGTCNQGGVVKTPCPADMILTMIRDGATGTTSGDGLARLLPKTPSQDDMKYYQAARMYNSGSIDPSGFLERGVATHCYASDIANRLTGWVSAPSKCRFDIDGLPALSSVAAVLGATRSLSQSAAATSSRRAGLMPIVRQSGTSASTTLSTMITPSSSAGLVFGGTISSSVAGIVFGGVQSESRRGLQPISRSPSAGGLQPISRAPSASAVQSASAPAASRAVATNPGPGVTTDCAQYYRVVSGDYCARIISSAGITLAQFRALNTGIDSSCTNVWLGYDYCIKAL